MIRSYLKLLLQVLVRSSHVCLHAKHLFGWLLVLKNLPKPMFGVDYFGKVNVISNSPSQDYTHLDNHTLLTCDMTPGLKPLMK